MNAQDVVLTVVIVALGGWFLARNRKALSVSAVVRHVIFIGFIWAGCVAMFHGDLVVRWVFGRDIYKGGAERDSGRSGAVGGHPVVVRCRSDIAGEGPRASVQTVRRDVSS